jgi:hypothetical protein
MRVICSECGILYNLKKPYEDDSETHGLCEICWPWVENNLKIEISRFISSHRPKSQQSGGPSMNHSKIHGLLVEYNDDLDLLDFFLKRNNYEACKNITRYLRLIGEDIDRLIDSIPSGSYGKAHPNPVTPEEVPTGNRTETAATSCNLEGLTLVLEREYRK